MKKVDKKNKKQKKNKKKTKKIKGKASKHADKLVWMRAEDWRRSKKEAKEANSAAADEEV